MNARALLPALLPALVLLSCSRPERARLTFDLDAADGIVAREAGDPLLSGLGASYTDGEGQVTPFPVADATAGSVSVDSVDAEPVAGGVVRQPPGGSGAEPRPVSSVIAILLVGLDGSLTFHAEA